jgi:hypothetical protein
MADKFTQAEGVTRLAFIKGSAGVAAGAAIVGAPAIALERSGAGKHAPAEVVTSPSPTPREPVMAYIRDPDVGEVTVVSGTGETTYRDPALVKRLMAATGPNGSTLIGGGADVLAP